MMQEQNIDNQYVKKRNNKVITIVICAYNMEKYIAKALKSCIINDINLIEVLIINDGSQDGTTSIANEYVTMYPDTFHHIPKKNGGWGSNINYAMHLITGKYFKILDADDWFDSEALQKLVNILSCEDADLFINDYVRCYTNKETYCTVADGNWKDYQNRPVVFKELPKYPFSIWNTTFKTDVFRKNYEPLLERTLYTDTLLILHYIPFIKVAYICPFPVYYYRLDRPGQSVSLESTRKHIEEYVTVLNNAIDFYLQYRTNENRQMLFQRVNEMYWNRVRILIVLSNFDDIKFKQMLIKLEEKAKGSCPELYEFYDSNKDVGSIKFRFSLFMLRKTNYILAPLFGILVRTKHKILQFIENSL